MIKRIYRFFCSMRFGMILLLLIAVLCIAATAGGAEWIYSSPVFIALFVMLSLNLLLCSIVRIFHLGDQKKALAQKAIRGETTLSVTDPALWLKKHHFRPDGDVFFRKSFGFLGSFFTHLSLLLIMIAMLDGATLIQSAVLMIGIISCSAVMLLLDLDERKER